MNEVKYNNPFLPQILEKNVIVHLRDGREFHVTKDTYVLINKREDVFFIDDNILFVSDIIGVNKLHEEIRKMINGGN